PADRRYEADLGGGEKLVNHVYKKRAVIYVPLTTPAGARVGERSISAVASGQLCGNVCIEVEAPASAAVTVGRAPVANGAWTGDLADGLKKAMPAAKLPSVRLREPTGAAEPVAPSGAAGLTTLTGLGLALLAGLILNVMPCVLPVVPLRILSLAQMAGQQRRRMITMGLAFAAGIVLFFLALGVVNVVLRLAAQRVFSLSGLFQFHPVRIGLAMVLVALSANLFGLFNVVVPGRLAGLGSGASQPGRGGHLTSVGMGLMMAVLATPCSFAILAKALAWAQLAPLWLGTVTIVTIGLGMAAPHAVLVAFPRLLDKLPRPGRWMEIMKQSMGFLLLPVAIWLIFAGSQDPYPGWAVAYGVVLTLCLWIWGTWVRYDATLRRKIVVRGLAALLAVGAGVWMLAPARESAVKFERFSHERIETAGREKRLVLVKFTSATCLSCIWLDRTVYSDPEVARELEARGVVALKGDTTDADAPESKMLRERFRGAPPLTVLLPPDGREPVRLDGKFTKADLLAALEKASAGGPGDG
ncbi:MAG: cytochrome c biogenesis protein CcdA, partial [Phycisphaerae bacterium]